MSLIVSEGKLLLHWFRLLNLNFKRSHEDREMGMKDPNGIIWRTIQHHQGIDSFPCIEFHTWVALKRPLGDEGCGQDGGGICLTRISKTCLLSQSLCHKIKHLGDNISQVTSLFVDYFSLGEWFMNNYFRNILPIFKIKHWQQPCWSKGDLLDFGR